MLKKHTILVIIFTALLTFLITNTYRDIMYVKKDSVVSQKSKTIIDKINTHSIYDYDEEKAADMAATGIAMSLNDPYTNYYSKDDFTNLKNNIQSSYIGIGITLSVDMETNKLIVVSAVENQSAQRHGILAKDYIIAVDGIPYSGEQMNDAVSVIKGLHLPKTEGTTVTLTIERDGVKSDITVPREVINIDTVSSKILDNNIGYIRITQFNSKNPFIEDAKDTYNEFTEQLSNLQSQNITSLIIDLRNNPGGDLDVVTKIADTLLPKGIITYTEDKNGHKTNFDSDSDSFPLPIAVLVNNSSASASEVLSGALKDYNKATLIGEKTFGKGVVQTVIPLPDGSGMTVTSARYFTPSGECIHEKGIEPDILIPFETEKAISDLTLDEDIQLQKAIEILQ